MLIKTTGMGVQSDGSTSTTYYWKRWGIEKTFSSSGYHTVFTYNATSGTPYRTYLFYFINYAAQWNTTYSSAAWRSKTSLMGNFIDGYNYGWGNNINSQFQSNGGDAQTDFNEDYAYATNVGRLRWYQSVTNSITVAASGWFYSNWDYIVLSS